MISARPACAKEAAAAVAASRVFGGSFLGTARQRANRNKPSLASPARASIAAPRSAAPAVARLASRAAHRAAIGVIGDRAICIDRILASHIIRIIAMNELLACGDHRA